MELLTKVARTGAIAKKKMFGKEILDAWSNFSMDRLGSYGLRSIHSLCSKDSKTGVAVRL